MTLPLRVLQVGCGHISSLWLEPAKKHPALAVVGLVDINAAAAQKQADAFGFDAYVGSDLDDAIAQTQPDVVFNCTIPAAHFEVTSKALNAGAHVLSEKPLADTMQQARDMLALCEQTGRTLAVMQNRRFNPNVRLIREVIASGVLGELTTINADFFLAAHFGGFRLEMPNILIKDMAIHTFDAARYFSNANAHAVYCYEWNPKASPYSTGAAAQAIFEMDDGIVFNYRGSWVSEGCHTPWESAWRIVGTEGSLTWDGALELKSEVVAKCGGFFSEFRQPDLPRLIHSDMMGWHGVTIDAFCKALATGETPETHAADNIHSLAMVFGAVESANKRERITFDWQTL